MNKEEFEIFLAHVEKFAKEQLANFNTDSDRRLYQINTSIVAISEPQYVSEKGRPSIDPEIFVRMILLEYLYNINSDRQLCEEICYNLAYRWFCKLSLTLVLWCK